MSDEWIAQHALLHAEIARNPEDRARLEKLAVDIKAGTAIAWTHPVFGWPTYRL